MDAKQVIAVILVFAAGVVGGLAFHSSCPSQAGRSPPDHLRRSGSPTDLDRVLVAPASACWPSSPPSCSRLAGCSPKLKTPPCGTARPSTRTTRPSPSTSGCRRASTCTFGMTGGAPPNGSLATATRTPECRSCPARLLLAVLLVFSIAVGIRRWLKCCLDTWADALGGYGRV